MSTTQSTRSSAETRSRYAGSPTGSAWLTAAGVVGPLLYVLAFTVAGLLRPGYSPIHQAVSDLGVGSRPWMLNIALVALGALLTAFVIGFRRGLGLALGSPWSWICAILLALPGAGFAWAGIFTEAPATVTLHWAVGMPLLTIGSVVGFAVTGLRLRRLAGWHGWGTYSFIAGVLTLAIIVAMFGTWTLGLGGVTERVLFVELLAWYVAFGWRLSSDRFGGVVTTTLRSAT